MEILTTRWSFATTGQFLDEARYEALPEVAVKEYHRYLDDDGTLVCPMEAHVIAMQKA